MKLDPVFLVKENKLYKIEDNSPFNLDSLKKVEIKWSTVEMEEESYNEEFLAELREQLKCLEASNQFAILVPIVDKELKSEEQFELFINAFNHTARRVKDCVSVAGFELPEELTDSGFDENSPAVNFMDTIAKKHAQYVSFAKLQSAPKDRVVLY